jgi:hypothetical protein
MKISNYTSKNRTGYSGILILSVYLLSTLFFTVIANAALPKEMSREQIMKEKWGIEVTTIRMAVDGRMVDFRYRVLDSKKPRPCLYAKISHTL